MRHFQTMDDMIAPYLRCPDTLRLEPTARAGSDTVAAYPAREVAAAIARLRGVRGASRRPQEPLDPTEAWNARLWRWREDDRMVTIGFHVRHGDSPDMADMWDGSPLGANCYYEDVARLAFALERRFPAVALRLADGRALTTRAFVAEVAMERLAPALMSDDSALRAQAQTVQTTYQQLLADAPLPADAEALRAAADLAILYEDAALLAVNKPTGIVTHPTYKHPDGTLTDAVFAREEVLGAPRPWLLHRLDKETSGVILFARADVARRIIVGQFEEHTAHKRYLALTLWPPDSGDREEGEVDAPLARDPLDRRRVIVAADGQPARTRYRRLASAQVDGAGYALLLAEPVTGRTHQIRAHLAAIGAPLVGDATYLPEGSLRRDRAARTMLHAWRLDLRSPTTGQPWSVTAPPPADFLTCADALGLGDALRAAVESGRMPA